MEPAVEVKELMERIRLAAERENSASNTDPGLGGSSPESDSRDEPSPRFITSAINEGVVDHLERLLPRAHQKNAVSGGVPKLLRPLFRNQGGFNAVMLNVAECLVSLTLQIVEQLGGFHEWADSVRQETTRNRSWIAATNVRLQSFKDERLIQIEARLNRLEQPSEHDENRRRNAPLTSPALREQTGDSQQFDARSMESAARLTMLEGEIGRLADLVQRQQLQLGEQGDYIRTVHVHLDKLGEHVDVGFAQQTRQAASTQEQLTRLGEQAHALQVATGVEPTG